MQKSNEELGKKVRKKSSYELNYKVCKTVASNKARKYVDNQQEGRKRNKQEKEQKVIQETSQKNVKRNTS